MASASTRRCTSSPGAVLLVTDDDMAHEDDIPRLDAAGAGRRAHKRAVRRLSKGEAIGALLPLVGEALRRAAEEPGATNQIERFLSPSTAVEWARMRLQEVSAFVEGGGALTALPREETYAAVHGRPPAARAVMDAVLALRDACSVRSGFEKLVIAAAVDLVHAGLAVERVDTALRDAYRAHAERPRR